ncbi:MAG: hypothetical protein KGQ77_08975, partial [Betaproteobacteria bacterium]|nr:hypothetical protein [Betaproteobacteria bacterium]
MRCALLLLALAGAACTHPSDADSYFPLQPGHAWRYAVRTDWEGGSAERDTLAMRTLPPDDQLGPSSFRRRSASGVDYWLRADTTGIYRVASK